MRVKSFLIVPALVMLMAPATHARAAEEVHCANIHEVTLAPGFSIHGSSGSFGVATVRTMECEGAINGRTPTGVGSYGEKPGRYGTKDPDSCQGGGEGDGVFFANVPTTDGNVELTAPYGFTIGDLTANPGFVSGEFSGEGVRGTFKVTPIEGDCVTSPITRVRVKADFWFAESFFRK